MDTIDKKTFMNLLWRYKRGSISRRHISSEPQGWDWRQR